MKYRPRICYTEEQKALMWDRWQKGESLGSIARLFDRGHSSIQRILAETGGIRPAQRRRSCRSLTLEDREEIQRNGGRRCYRASTADQAAWNRACRPKTCKLVEEPSAGPCCRPKTPIGVGTRTNCRLAQTYLSRR